MIGGIVMATQKKQVLIRVHPATYEKFKVISDRNHRAVSNQLEWLMLQFITEYETANGQISLAVSETQPKVVQKNLGGVNNLAVNGNVYN